MSPGRQVQNLKYPLEGKDFFHASNCDSTHHIYHQAPAAIPYSTVFQY
jgi:hypothetical protein